MASKLLWDYDSGDNADLLTTELNNFSVGDLAVDAGTFANHTNLFTHAAFQLFIDDWDAAPTAGDFIELHLFWYINAAWCDGNGGGFGGTTKVSGNTRVGTFMLNTVDADQYLQLMGIPLMPFSMKAALLHQGSADFTAVDTHFLKIAPFNLEGQ